MGTPRQWTVQHLDTLGNWSGANPGSFEEPAHEAVETWSDPEGDGQNEQLLAAYTHVTDGSNRIGWIGELPDWDDPPAPQTEATHHYDAAGNLIADEEYFYQYDAWNRLVRVDNRGTLTFDTDGVIVSGSRGDWVSVFVYDGLGRLTQKRSRWVNVANELRRENHNYDGVRRQRTSRAACPRTRWRLGWATARRSRRSTIVMVPDEMFEAAAGVW